MYSLLVFLAGLVAVPAGAAPARIAVVPACREAPGAAAMGSFARGILSAELARRVDVVLLDQDRLGQVLRDVRCGRNPDAGQGDGPPLVSGPGLGDGLAVKELFVVDVQPVYSGYSIIVRVEDAASGRIVRVEALPVGARLAQARAPLVRLARDLVSRARVPASERMVRIPAGRLTMGSTSGLADERPVHKVQISAFYLDRFEVTRAQLHEFRESGAQVRATATEGPDLPATGVGWSEAAAYCRSLGKRLPYEAEWEFAARGESGTLFPWGNSPPDAQRACFADTAPVPVETLPAGSSPLGIYHLAGNAAEWVNDRWAADYYARSPEPDPRGPLAGDYRVVRGGSFRSSAVELRAAARSFHDPQRGSDEIGFRCARDANP